MLINYIRTLILYVLVAVAMRLMGKKQIGQLQPSEFVITLMLSELATFPIQDTAIPLFYGILPILTLFSLEIIVSFILLKSNKARSILEGDAAIIIKHGVLQKANMEKMRYNINDVMEELRLKGISDIREVEYAILETNGNLSVIQAAASRPVCADDLKIKLRNDPFYFPVVCGGEFDIHGLRRTGLTEEKVKKYLRDKGIKDIKQVFYAAADENGGLYAQLEGGKLI